MAGGTKDNKFKVYSTVFLTNVVYDGINVNGAKQTHSAMSCAKESRRIYVARKSNTYSVKKSV